MIRIMALGIGDEFTHAINAQMRFSSAFQGRKVTYHIIADFAEDKSNEGSELQQIWYQKLCILDKMDFSNEDWVILHDADFHLVESMPIFEDLEERDARNMYVVKDRNDKAVVIDSCNELDINPDLYFNSGFYICNYQLLKEILKEAKKVYHAGMRWGDQDALNYVVQKGEVAEKVNVCYLPANHNYLDFQAGDNIKNFYGIHNKLAHTLNKQ